MTEQSAAESPPRARRALFRDRAAVVGGGVLALIIVTAALAPVLSPYNADEQQALNALAEPSWEHPMGTDQFGRDMATRVASGARVSIMIGVSATLLGLLIGGSLGILGGYYGRLLDSAIMRTVDVAFAFPVLIFAILIVVILGPSIRTVVISIGVAFSPFFARLARSVTISIREREYVEAARAAGVSNSAILRHHILPNVFPTIFVYATTSIGLAIVTGASLSFLGIGVQPPTADLGRMVADLSPLIFTEPTLAFYPGIAIAAIALAVNLLGDGLVRLVDPAGERALL